MLDGGKHLFSCDEIRYHEGDRMAEKVLERKPLWYLTTSVEKLMKNLFLANTEVTQTL
jgi:hypothetical protein